MYYGTTINESPIIAGILGENIDGEASFLAVKFNESGELVKAGANENAVGLIVPGCGENLKEGDEVTVQIKDIGKAIAAGNISAGAAVTTAEGGKVAAAAAGNFVLGFALAAATEGKAITIQITKSGVVATA